MKQTKPRLHQIEVTRGCNKRCGFCGIQAIPNKPEFMTPTTAERIGQELSWTDPVRIDFGLRGEATMNPEWAEITRIFRRTHPNSQIMTVTNGILLTEEKARAFFRAGGNILFVDCYDGTKAEYKRRFAGFNTVEYYGGTFNPYHNHGPKNQIVCLTDDIATRQEDGAKITRVLHNQASNVNYDRAEKYGIHPITEPLVKRCVIPFRELDVYWNGDIPQCCLDWTGQSVTRNVMQGGTENWWYNDKELYAKRLLLHNRYRDFLMCRVCTFRGGMRQGIIPDMPKITPEQAANIAKQIDRKERSRHGNCYYPNIENKTGRV